MSVNPEDFYSKEHIEFAKKLGQFSRAILGDSFMSEAELTQSQRECKEPVGTKGYYRMYKWFCHVCAVESVRLPYSEAMLSGFKHVQAMEHPPNPRNPPVRVIGGVFPKELLYK